MLEGGYDGTLFGTNGGGGSAFAFPITTRTHYCAEVLGLGLEPAIPTYDPVRLRCRFDSKLNAITAVLGQIKVEAKRPGTARAAGIDELTPRVRVGQGDCGDV